jgi:hypothetical protein
MCADVARQSKDKPVNLIEPLENTRLIFWPEVRQLNPIPFAFRRKGEKPGDQGRRA